MTVITMSRTEIDRMSVLQDLADRRIRIAEASALMRLGRRQVFRLAKAYGKHGPQALVSRRRGRPSNRCYPTALRAEVIGMIRERYSDFGPTLAAEKLAELAWKEERTVSMNLTLQYDQVLFILEPTGIARSLARKRVTVIDYPDGRLVIRHNGVDLPYRTFDKRQQVNQAAIVENKRLGPILAYIAEQQKQLDMSRSAKAPRRRGQKNHMFKVG